MYYVLAAGLCEVLVLIGLNRVRAISSPDQAMPRLGSGLGFRETLTSLTRAAVERSCQTDSPACDRTPELGGHRVRNSHG